MNTPKALQKVVSRFAQENELNRTQQDRLEVLLTAADAGIDLESAGNLGFRSGYPYTVENAALIMLAMKAGYLDALKDLSDMKPSLVESMRKLGVLIYRAAPSSKEAGDAL